MEINFDDNNEVGLYSFYLDSVTFCMVEMKCMYSTFWTIVKKRASEKIFGQKEQLEIKDLIKISF